MWQYFSALAAAVFFAVPLGFLQLQYSALHVSRFLVAASDPTFQVETGPNASIDGQNAQARDLLLKAGALLKQIPEWQQFSAAANIASQLTRAGDLADALATVRHLETPDDQAYAMGSVGYQLVDRGNPAQALALLKNSQDGQGKDFAYAIVSQLLAERNDFEQALQAAHLIKGSDRRLDTLVRIAILQGKAGKRAHASETLQEALRVAENISYADPNSALSLLTIARAQIDIGESAETSAVASRFAALARKKKENGQGDILLQVFAGFQAQTGDFAEALQTVEDLSEGAADYALKTIAEEYAKRQSMGEALRVAARISDRSSRERAFSAIAGAARQHEKSDGSLEAINAMQDPTARAEALANLALDQARWQESATYQTLLRWQAETDGGAKASDIARGTAAVAYGLMGNFADSQQLLAEITKPEGRQWPLWNLTQFLANKGKAQQAANLAEQEKDPLPKLYALLGTAQGLLDNIEAEAASNGGNPQK